MIAMWIQYTRRLNKEILPMSTSLDIYASELSYKMLSQQQISDYYQRFRRPVPMRQDFWGIFYNDELVMMTDTHPSEVLQ